MNIVVLKGRLTKDVESNATQGGMTVGRFTVAVDRRNKDKNDTDFITCVAFGKTAENIAKYIHKGDEIVVSGNIKTGSYTNKENRKVYTTDVWVDRFDFCGGSKKGTSSSQESFGSSAFDEDIPF